MRYKSIELINYAGIYNGMQLTQIFIDFTKCVSNKIIIRGSNGSGKSTLINAINPNPDSNDKFIPGAEARKTLVLSDGFTDYVIRYIHPVTQSGRGTTKGYIAKTINGQLVELNPNGNISSCKDILYDEFGLDASYISLAQLSSEDRGLVDKKPVERKKLINNISNSLDTYNNIYKAVSKKSSTLKSLIGNITNKIDMIGDETKVLAALNNLEQRIKTLDDERDTTIEAIASVKLKMNEAQSVLDDNKYDEIVTELAMVNKMLTNSSKFIQDQFAIYNITNIENLDLCILSIEKQIITLESAIDALNSRIPSILLERENEVKSLQEKQNKLNSLQGEYNYDELKTAIEQLEVSLREYQAVFDNMHLNNIDIITKDEFDAAMDSLKFLRDGARDLTASFRSDLVQYFIENRYDALDKISKLKSIKDEIENLKKQKSELEKLEVEASTKRSIAKALNNRPIECKIDDCPYISAAVSAEMEWSESKYNELIDALHDIEINFNILYHQQDEYIELQEISIRVNALERELNSKIKLIKKLPVRPDFQETFLIRAGQRDSFNDIDTLYKFIDCGNLIEEFKVAKEQYKIYMSEFDIYKSKNEIIESIIADIESIQSKVDKLAQSVDETNAQILESKERLEKAKTVNVALDNVKQRYSEVYKPNKDRQEELTKLKESLDFNVEHIKVLRQRLEQLNKNLGAVNSDIKNLSEQRDAYKHSLVMLADYKMELDKYNKEYSLIEKVRYYASPNTGIQSIFIGLYMNRTLSLANELLSMLFNGEFILEPFIVNESEFRIPCRGDGLSHDDISSMSTAQKTAISMIISFALLHQSSTKYNIICLDEADGGYDSLNRSQFISLLDRLMNLLNCEQAFLISHNNEIDTSACDMICLKNTTSELMNGHIIWKF